MSDLLLFILLLGFLKLVLGWKIGAKYVKVEPYKYKTPYCTAVPYYSNGKLIDEPHWLHYARTLNLLHLDDIDDVVILKASSSSLSDRLKSEPYFELSELREISAATFFLIDKWKYLSHLN